MINHLGLCVTVEVNNVVIMKNNQFLYENIGWELNIITNKSYPRNRLWRPIGL
jgi:hypothetical protein